jgi:hypothetical protein
MHNQRFEFSTSQIIARPMTGRGYIFTSIFYTECPRRNVPDFGRVFLMLKYTDITQDTWGVDVILGYKWLIENGYVMTRNPALPPQSWTVTEIIVRVKCGLLSVPRIVYLSRLSLSVCPWLRTPIAISSISTVFVAAAVQSPMLSQCVTYSAWNSKDSYDTACEFFVVQFNAFMSLTS